MKKIKLLMLLSAAMLLMGKANLCSSTYATDGNRKINESAEGNKSDEDFKAPKSRIEEAESKLKKLSSKGRFAIPNEFNENIDKRKAVPKDVDISEKKKLINELIDNLIKCKFFKEDVIVKDIVVYSVELNHLYKCYNELLDLAQGIFSLYENFKKNRDFSPRELDGIKKSFKKCWGNLFEFEFNDEFLSCLNNSFKGLQEEIRLKNFEQFVQIMFNTHNTIIKFINKNKIEEFISNKYNSVKIPNNFDKDVHHTEIKSEQSENFEDFIRSAVNLDGSKQKKEENSTNLGVSNVGVDHFKFIYNKFTDLITRVNGIYVLSEAAVDFKTVIRGYISQNKSDENKKVIEKAIEDFNSYLKKFFGSQLGFEFESIVTNACTKLKLEDRAKDYEKFIEKSEKIVSGLEAIIKKFEENDRSSANKQTKNDKKDANSLDANKITSDIFKDDDMLDDEKLENIKSFTDSRYEKFELPSDYDVATCSSLPVNLDTVKLTKEEKKLFDDQVQAVSPYIDALFNNTFFTVKGMNKFRILQINADHIKLIHNKLIDLINAVEEMYRKVPEYLDGGFSSAEYENILLENYKRADKLINDLGFSLFSILDCLLSVNFIESTFRSAVNFSHKHNWYHYVLFELIAFNAVYTLRGLVDFLKNHDENCVKVQNLIKKCVEEKKLTLSQNAQNNVSQNKPSGEQQNAQNNALNNVLQNKPSGEQQKVQNNVSQNKQDYSHIKNEELREKLIYLKQFISNNKKIYIPVSRLLNNITSQFLQILENIEKVEEKNGKLEIRRKYNQLLDYIWIISRDEYVFRKINEMEQLKKRLEQKNKQTGAQQNAQNKKLSDELVFNDNLKNMLGEKNDKDKDKDKDALKNKLNNNLNNKGKEAFEPISLEEFFREEDERIEKEEKEKKKQKEKEKEKQKDVSSAKLLKKKTNRPE